MGKLGISIYPERSTYEKDKAYLDLAHQYGFKRVFTSLLQITEDKEKVLADFKKVVDYANALNMEVMVDIMAEAMAHVLQVEMVVVVIMAEYTVVM